MVANPITIATTATLLGMFVVASFYAVFIHLLNKRYERAHTWAVAMGGIALVGAVVAVRYTLPIPDYTGRAMLWWTWMICFLHFCSAAVPIIIYSYWDDAQARKEAARVAGE